MARDMDLTHIREALEKESARLVELLERQAEGETVIEDNPDEEDLADALADRERNGFIEEIDSKLLEQVKLALGRLDAGTYGVCTRCGEEIAQERLEALPYAEHCMRCQGIAERQARQAD